MASNAAELIEALNQISKEKGINKEDIFEAIESSMILACKKNFGSSDNIKVEMDRESGEVRVLATKEVVQGVEDAALQISLGDAQSLDPDIQLGSSMDIVVTPRNFGRISAQTAKQVIVQKFREIEREQLYAEFAAKDKELVAGIVQRRERRNIIVAIGKMEAIMPPTEQLPGETLGFGNRVKVFVTEVRQTTKGPSVTISRAHPELVHRLFEQEVPEVFDGTVEILSLAREAGSRTKIAVSSKLPEVDAVGACVGPNGQRVAMVVSELNGEKIDVVSWDEDPVRYISAALSPSKVTKVIITPNTSSAKVVVPDNQLSLAIGKDGQNARLSARLTGYKIDIKSESQWEKERELLPKHPDAEQEYEDYEDYEDDYGVYDDEYDYDDYDDDYDDDYGEYDDEYEYDEEWEDVAQEEDKDSNEKG